MHFGARLDSFDPTYVEICRSPSAGGDPEVVTRLSPELTADFIEVLKQLHDKQLGHLNGRRIQLPPLALVK